MKEQKVSNEDLQSMGKTIPHEVNLLYILSLSCDAMIFDIERRMKDVSVKLHLKRESKMHLNEYLSILKKAKVYFENFICPSIINCSATNNFRAYEECRVFSQEILRLIMLYYETCLDDENHKKVFDLLCSFGDKRRGAFGPEDINRFDLGCKK